MGKPIIIALVTFCVGLGIGLYFQKTDSITSQRCKSDSFKWINPNLECKPEKILSKTNYTKLENTLNQYLARKRNEGVVNEVSLYFRDLNQGPTFGINEDEEYIPASLMKLPLLLTFYKIAETNPEIIKENASYREDVEFVQPYYLPDKTLEDGKLYTVEELLHQMIVYSDNNATISLRRYLASYYPGKDVFLETLRDLALLYPDSSIDENTSVKRYSSIFRLLYNISYLPLEYSEKALDLMSQSRFKHGLVKGVPAGIPVAHKFGERVSDDGLTGLHDCGIVYYPNNPYILCIMTKGEDIDKLANLIQDISSMVYEEVDERKIR